DALALRRHRIGAFDSLAIQQELDQDASARRYAVLAAAAAGSSGAEQPVSRQAQIIGEAACPGAVVHVVLHVGPRRRIAQLILTALERRPRRATHPWDVLGLLDSGVLPALHLHRIAFAQEDLGDLLLSRLRLRLRLSGTRTVHRRRTLTRTLDRA